MINLNKRINEHKKGFDVLRSADTSDLPSLKVFNVLQSVEKAMKQRQLSNYTLLSIYLNRSKSYFKVILMLAGDINLNLGPITMVDNYNMWNDLPFRKCNLSID